MTTIKRRRRDIVPTGAVVGIDQSYSGFAVCVLYHDGTAFSTRAEFKPEKYGQGVDRLCAIGAYLGKVLNDVPCKVMHVCMEGYAPNSKFGREQAGELGAVVKLALRTSPVLASPRCYPTIVATTKLKKFVTGKGSGPGSAKSDMKLAVYKKWGVSFNDDNDADAYGLAKVAAAIQWPNDNELLAYQHDVMKELAQHTER